MANSRITEFYDIIDAYDFFEEYEDLVGCLDYLDGWVAIILNNDTIIINYYEGLEPLDIKKTLGNKDEEQYFLIQPKTFMGLCNDYDLTENPFSLFT